MKNRNSVMITIICVVILLLTLLFGQSYVDAGEGWDGLGRAILVLFIGGISIVVIFFTWLITAIVNSIEKKKAGFKNWFISALIFGLIIVVIAISIIIRIIYVKNKPPVNYETTIHNINSRNYSKDLHYDIEHTNITIYGNEIYINNDLVLKTNKDFLIGENGKTYIFYLYDEDNKLIEVYAFNNDGKEAFHLKDDDIDGNQYVIYNDYNIIELYRLYNLDEKGKYASKCPTNYMVKVHEVLTLEPKIAEVPNITCILGKVSLDSIKMDTINETKYDKDIITSYDEYKELFNSNQLTEQDFINNNYYILSIPFDACSEEDVKLVKTELDNDTLNVSFTYKAKCGVCAPEYIIYLIKLDKTITNINLNLTSKATNKPKCDPHVSYKPLIYLYPEEKTDVTIKLGYPKRLTTTYPKYDKQWKVTAYPNGDLKDNKNTYYGLYWEGITTLNPTFEDGFVVEKENLISFLEEKLSILGLNDKEKNEFIIYWLPKLEENKYNLIRFESIDNINNDMPLMIDPKPDSIIRVLMEFKPIDKEINIKEQELTTPKRTGFTVVEWGGTIIK